MGFIMLVEKGILLKPFKAFRTRHYFRILEAKLARLVQHRCPKVIFQ